MKIIVALVLCLVACQPESEPFLFAGWSRISAVEADAYCSERGAVVVPVPVTDEEIEAARVACELGDETGPCWVGVPSDTEATVITIDGFIVVIPRDLGPALALCQI